MIQPPIPTRQAVIARAVEVAEATGFGLAATWGLIHAGDYAAAWARLDALETSLP